MSNKIYIIQKKHKSVLYIFLLNKKITAPILGAAYGIHKTAIGHRLRCRIAAQCPVGQIDQNCF